MKTIVLALFCLVGMSATTQVHLSLDTLTYSGDEPIHVQKLATDSLATSFVIWIKTEVKAHFHAQHTEYVVILEGSGTMMLGDEHFTVQAGDLVYIPSNTPHSVEVTSDEAMKVLSVQTPEFKGKDRIFVRPYQRNKG